MSRYKFQIGYVLYRQYTFVNYLDKFPNLTESLEFLNIKKKITFEQILPISLNISKYDPTLLTVSSDLKEIIHRYTNKKKFLICRKGMIAWN